jgi:hypothetical protein
MAAVFGRICLQQHLRLQDPRIYSNARPTGSWSFHNYITHSAGVFKKRKEVIGTCRVI